MILFTPEIDLVTQEVIEDMISVFNGCQVNFYIFLSMFHRVLIVEIETYLPLRNFKF